VTGSSTGNQTVAQPNRIEIERFAVIDQIDNRLRGDLFERPLAEGYANAHFHAVGLFFVQFFDEAAFIELFDEARIDKLFGLVLVDIRPGLRHVLVAGL
jgi:hypothetical protein